MNARIAANMVTPIRLRPEYATIRKPRRKYGNIFFDSIELSSIANPRADKRLPATVRPAANGEKGLVILFAEDSILQFAIPV